MSRQLDYFSTTGKLIPGQLTLDRQIAIRVYFNSQLPNLNTIFFNRPIVHYRVYLITDISSDRLINKPDDVLCTKTIPEKLSNTTSYIKIRLVECNKKANLS